MTHTILEVGSPRVRIKINNIAPDKVLDRVVIHPKMKLLIDKILVRNPTWHVLFRGVFSSNYYPLVNATPDNPCNLVSADVYQGGELLGLIGCETCGDRKYVLDSPSLRDGRMRGIATRTAKLDKALKIIAEHFKPQSTEDVLASAEKKARDTNNGLVFRATTRFEHITKIAMPHIMAYLVDNWDSVFNELHTKYSAQPRDLLSLYETHLEKLLTQKLVASDGVVVVVRDGGYIVGDTEPGLCDDVPINLRANLGILKMANTGVPLPDIGTRVEDNIFFVIPEKLD